jgi:hypothetical protein
LIACSRKIRHSPGGADHTPDSGGAQTRRIATHFTLPASGGVLYLTPKLRFLNGDAEVSVRGYNEQQLCRRQALYSNNPTSFLSVASN